MKPLIARHRSSAILAAGLVGGVALASAQVPAAGSLAPARADHLAGLYRFDDGRLAHVMDLRDQLNGQPTLSVTEYDSGRIRGLYPAEGGRFNAGAAWFRPTPLAYSISFDESRVPAPSLTWTEGGARQIGRRVPMVERAVTVRNGSIVLAGTLALPPGPGKHPAVVMVPGSGPLTRRTLRYVGDLLVASGLAVLTMDKRGTGGSSGSWNGLSHRDWAADVNAQLDWLKAQPGIDATRMGLYAGSEGGFVAPTVAASRSDIRFLACRVCSALPHVSVILDMETGAIRRRGLSEGDVTKARALLEQLMRYAIERTDYERVLAAAAGGEGASWRAAVALPSIPGPEAPYWDRYRGVLDVHPRDAYARLRTPVLVILGERDERLLVEKHRPVFEALRRNGADLTLWVIPGASHGLLLDESTAPRYPAGFHARLASWIAEAAGADHGPLHP